VETLEKKVETLEKRVQALEASIKLAQPMLDSTNGHLVSFFGEGANGGKALIKLFEDFK